MINPNEYLDKKFKIMADYFLKENITGVVFGLSGGVDSAVTLGLYLAFQKQYPNVLQIVQPVIAPISDSVGTTDQVKAKELAYQVLQHFNHESFVDCDLGVVSKKYSNFFDFPSQELVQQMDYWLRPTYLYGVAHYFKEKLCLKGHVILSSTCNKSEWMSGYFSSYLDILALNPLIDLWKSEVYALANHFNIPKEVIDTPPSGGIANGNTDEEEFGFTYKDLERYYCLKMKHPNPEIIRLIQERIESSEFKREKFNPVWLNKLSV